MLSVQKMSPLRFLSGFKMAVRVRFDCAAVSEHTHTQTNMHWWVCRFFHLHSTLISPAEKIELLNSVARSPLPWLQWLRDKAKGSVCDLLSRCWLSSLSSTGRKWKANISNVLIYKIIITKTNVYMQEESQHRVSVASQWATFYSWTLT